MAETGVWPLYEKASWCKNERAFEREIWYGNYKSVSFVQATLDSLLKKEIKAEVEKLIVNVLVGGQ